MHHAVMKPACGSSKLLVAYLVIAIIVVFMVVWVISLCWSLYITFRDSLLRFASQYSNASILYESMNSLTALVMYAFILLILATIVTLLIELLFFLK